MKGVNDGGPAFPMLTPGEHSGMTLRDYFAGQVLAGVYSMVFPGFETGSRPVFDLYSDESLADFAYQQADAMIERRGKPSEWRGNGYL